jgi:transposase InsO family protein
VQGAVQSGLCSRDQGIVIGERRVGRLIRDNDIRVVTMHKFKRTTNSNHKHNIAPNLLDGDFQATGPNQKWAGDISLRTAVTN